MSAKTRHYAGAGELRHLARTGQCYDAACPDESHHRPPPNPPIVHRPGLSTVRGEREAYLRGEWFVPWWRKLLWRVRCWLGRPDRERIAWLELQCFGLQLAGGRRVPGAGVGLSMVEMGRAMETLNRAFTESGVSL